MAEKIGFVGLGIMGKPMARNLMKAGYEVTVYDLFPAPVDELVSGGATRAESAAEVARNSSTVVVMVQNSPQSEAAILGENGVLSGASKGNLIIDMSSIEPGTSQKVGAACDAAGVGFLDAPVSGGEPFAISGDLAIMVGGNAADFETAKPLFEVMGKSSVLCGGHGAGNVVKLANQICVAGNILALAEAMTLAAKAGVNPETVFDAIKGGLAGSNVMNAKAPMMFQRNFKPGFRIELHYKDLNNAMTTANALNVPLVMTAQMQQVLGALMEWGYGKEDHAGFLHFPERLSGVEVKKF
ncbi:MAG: 2-hydroxy-3-oxopropionate reductase [Chloroflexi bacterium]|nr:2-hydroxy-3-oxopropionate reductase [Chloroflexota bacterium]MDA1298096.1 2-hydroxy-3-oxopropionate reductase [Chloroflexota bacterium]